KTAWPPTFGTFDIIIYRFLKNISFSGIVNTMKIDLSIFMSCKAGFLLTISLFGQQEVIFYENG
ncbi:hypothetical protein, partial [Pseudobutyrivibrio sp.]